MLNWKDVAKVVSNRSENTKGIKKVKKNPLGQWLETAGVGSSLTVEI